MTRFTGGWIRIYREAVDGDLGERPFLLGLFVKLLLWANWKESSAQFKGERVTVKPGQLITGLRELSPSVEEDPHMHKVRNALSYLEKRGTITQATCNRGRLITICNWEEYQIESDDTCKPSASEAQTDRKQSANRPQLSEEVKKGRKEEEVGTVFADANPGPTPSAVIPELDDPFTNPFVAQTAEKTQQGWVATFEDASWIKLELKKAVTHTEANPRKKPKSGRGWSTFFSGWLNRGWEWKRRHAPSGGPVIAARRPPSEDPFVTEMDRIRKAAVGGQA